MKLRHMTYTEGGQRKLTKKLYAVFADHNGVIRKLPLFADRKNAAEAARCVERLVGARASGDGASPELSRFIENTLPSIRAKLAEWGIIDAARTAAGKSLAEHLDDWAAFLGAKGNTPDYVALASGRARTVFDACGFRFWGDVAGDAVQARLAAMRNKPDGDIGAQTSNFYLQAAKQFCRWMVRPARRATDSPLAHLSGLNVRSDRRHDRRAFTLDELLHLLGHLSTAPVRAKMTGSERALLYRLAVETGLRRGGLAKLTKASFDLGGGEPAVVVKAGAKNKYKAERRVPLRAATAELLRARLAHLAPDAPAFAVPPRQHSAKMVRADLNAARTAWLAESPTPAVRAERERGDFLRYRDSAGRYLDFHALRHTRGVWLFEHHKAHPREVQELMGVASLALVDRYTRSFRLTDLSVIERGPDLSVRPADAGVKAAGGGEVPASKTLSPSLSPKGGTRQTKTDCSGQVRKASIETDKHEPTEKQASSPGELNGEGEIRTPVTLRLTGFRNRRIQPLCHLSRTFCRRYPKRQFGSNRRKSPVVVLAVGPGLTATPGSRRVQCRVTAAQG